MIRACRPWSNFAVFFRVFLERLSKMVFASIQYARWKTTTKKHIRFKKCKPWKDAVSSISSRFLTCHSYLSVTGKSNTYDVSFPQASIPKITRYHEINSKPITGRCSSSTHERSRRRGHHRKIYAQRLVFVIVFLSVLSPIFSSFLFPFPLLFFSSFLCIFTARLSRSCSFGVGGSCTTKTKW